jgi:hypothetical protein
MRKKLRLGATAAALVMFGFAPAATAQDADQPGDASTQARLAAGQSVEGDISPPGDADWYRLSVERGQRYSLALDGVPVGEGQAIDPMLGIYDAQGNQLAFNDDANNSLNSALQYAPQENGEVFVEARAYSNQATGRYRLNVSASPIPPDDAGNDASTRARVTPGRPVNGNIEYEGDVDWYRLAARLGQRYRISLARSGDDGLGDPLLRVLDRDGAELAVNDDSEGTLNSALEFIPERSSEVFVEARAYADNYSGAYTLSVEAERLPTDTATADRSTRGRINVGQSITSELGFAGDRDWYRIRLEGGGSYRFTLVSAGDNGLGDPLIRLFDSAGQELAMDDDGGDGLNSYLEFTAQATGVYFVEARGFSDGATGGYTLSALEGDIPANSSTDAILSVGGDYREGMLSPAGDRDWYRVDVLEGQGLRIALNSSEAGDALGDPYIVLYGPDGAEVARDDDSGEGLNAWLEHQAAAAGSLFIEARGFSDDAVGRYVISITAGEIGASADSADYLAPNSDGRTSIIGAEGDVDWFAIQLIEGRPYRFYLDGVEPGALADPYLALYDAEGAQVAADDDGGAGLNSYITFASPTGGAYYAAASSFGDAGTGRYALRVTDTDVPGNQETDENLDANDDDRVSRIDMPGDLDYYRVELESGVRYVVDVRGHGDAPLADAFLTILNDENERVTSDDDSGDGLDARARFTPEESGVYYIQASGLGGSTGWYQVRIVRQ